MKVKELIQELLQCDQEADIFFVNNEYGALEDIEEINSGDHIYIGWDILYRKEDKKSKLNSVVLG